MPVRVKKVGSRYRVVESDGSIAKNRSGTAVDGGGHQSREKALAQAAAINRSK